MHKPNLTDSKLAAVYWICRDFKRINIVLVQRDRGRGPWGRGRARGPEKWRARGSCSRSWRNLHVLIILKTSKWGYPRCDDTSTFREFPKPRNVSHTL